MLKPSSKNPATVMVGTLAAEAISGDDVESQAAGIDGAGWKDSLVVETRPVSRPSRSPRVADLANIIKGVLLDGVLVDFIETRQRCSGERDGFVVTFLIDDAEESDLVLGLKE